ncbi:MAG: type II toxin-antitoxin system death-on-curing family toxin [Alphaproteobacteria bacterium]|nr:type II toxin-antitoxin system death-on-curing family toxin [Alphaproteobacteria bacterium]
MTTWRWLSKDAVAAMHAEQLAEHGGSPGVRDEGLLESALARPLNQAADGEPTITELAAAYAFGIARNHPFIDGNKRTAFVGAATFLAVNGYEMTASEPEVVTTILKLAEGSLTDVALAAWFAANSRPQR